MNTNSKSGVMKRAAIFMALILSAGMLWAGGGQSKKAPAGTGNALNDPNIDLSGKLPIIKDPSKFPKLVMAYVNSPDRVVPVKDLILAQELKKATGVEFEWLEIPQDGSSEKINLMLASGQNLPDAFWNGIDSGMVAQYMNQDILRPTEDLVEKYMSRLKAIYKKRPEYKAGATAPNGHSYGFPYIEEMHGLVLTPGPFVINKEWLKKAGKPMPKTVDEFTAVLKAFRDGGDLNGNGKADEIPYALDFTNTDVFGSYNTFHQFTGAFGMADPYCTLNPNGSHMRVINNKIVFSAMDTAYRDTAKYFNMLRNERLVDMDSFSPGPSPGNPLFKSKLTGSDAVIGVFGLWSRDDEIPDWNVRDQYQSIPRLQGIKGKTGFALNATEMHNPSRVAVTMDCKYPEVIAAFVDYCFEPEVSVTLNWGAIGYLYTRGSDGKLLNRLDAKGNFILTPPYKTANDERTNTTPTGGALAVLNEYYDTVAEYPFNALMLLNDQIANGKNEFLAEYPPIPNMILTTDEQNTISRLQPTISDIVRRYTVQWVLDGNIDATWNNYLNELKAAGVDDLVRAMQGAYDRFLKAK
ncbi:MAG: extracellular solute-binding protein [Treponema sp.]|nr:extracellular solute-binding protein [Treponema sp.]